MSTLLELRKKLNITQEELAQKANVSVRTIQRIEAGSTPKGFTLKALAEALDVEESNLLEESSASITVNSKLILYINLSSILLIFIPLGSIALPLFLMFWKKEINPITKQIVTLQIIWTLAGVLLIVASSFFKNWFGLSNQVTSFTILGLIVLNLFIILRNAKEIQQNNKLHIKLNFNLI